MMILPLFLAAISLSPTASPSVIPTPTTTSEIQKFREVIQEKVKAKLQEINQAGQTDPKRGYLGTITKIDGSTISFDTKNKNITATFNTETAFLNTKSTKIKSSELKVGQEVLVIGLQGEQDSFVAKRIILVTPKSIQNLKTIVYGQVVDVSTTYSIIALIPTNNKNAQYQIKTDTKNLQILSKTGEKLTIKDITKGKKIIIISTSTPVSNQTLAAEKIIVM